MTVQVLISTMNQTDHSLIEKMNISTDAVVVNQCGKDSVEEFFAGHNKIKWINSSTIGLSVSRNICLKNATADICLLADDDLYYVDNYEEIVINAFRSNPGYSLIRLIATGIERPFKQYPKKSEEVGFFSSFKISSVELAVLRKKIRGLRFDR